MAAVFARELLSLFAGLSGFIFSGFFLLLTGVFFVVSNLAGEGSSDFRATLGNISFVCLVTIPVLTMRLLSEESRQKTDQLLLTSPVSLAGVVTGKYLAAFTLFTVTLAVTGIYPAMLDAVGLIVFSEVFGSYLGVFLMGAAFIAVGLFVSSLTDNQVIAAVATFGALLVMWVMEWLSQTLPTDRVSGAVFAGLVAAALAAWIWFNLRHPAVTAATAAVGGGAVLAVWFAAPAAFDGLIVRVLKWFSLVSRFAEYQRGVFSLGPLVYAVTFTAAFVFLTVRVVEKRRWK